MTPYQPVYDKFEALRDSICEQVQWWEDLYWWEKVLLTFQGCNLNHLIRANVIGGKE